MHVVENFVNLRFKKKSWTFNHHGLITQGSRIVKRYQLDILTITFLHALTVMTCGFKF